jgi:hypothetical protein
VYYLCFPLFPKIRTARGNAKIPAAGAKTKDETVDQKKNDADGHQNEGSEVSVTQIRENNLRAVLQKFLLLAFARLCLVYASFMPRFASLCRALPRFASLCRALPRFASLAVPRCAALCRAVPRCAALCRALPRFAALCRALPRFAALAVPRCAALCRAVPRCAALCRAVPRFAALCRALPRFAALCRALPRFAALCMRCVAARRHPPPVRSGKFFGACRSSFAFQQQQQQHQFCLRKEDRRLPFRLLREWLIDTRTKSTDIGTWEDMPPKNADA